MEEEIIIEFPNQFFTLVGIRQVFWMGQGTPLTYEQCIDFGIELSPKVIAEDGKLARSFESATVQLYQQRSASRSKSGQQITAADLLKQEIDDLKADYTIAAKGERAFMSAEINRLTRALWRIDKEKYTEHRVIERDTDQLPPRYAPVIEKGQGFKLYGLPNGHNLAVRILHPDKTEGISGVDIVYETYTKVSGDEDIYVRLAVIQYKMWNAKKITTSQAKSLESQLGKMQKHFCNESDFCKPPTGTNSNPYRLPYCSAFLRLTDYYQTKNGWRITDGEHIRVCFANQTLHNKENETQFLSKKDIDHESISQDAFQDLYRVAKIGSRLLTLDEMRNMYQRFNLFDAVDKIVIHSKDINW